MLLLPLQASEGLEGAKTIQNFDAKFSEKLFKMLGENPSDTQTDLLMFFSIWAAEFAMMDVKS
jgi:hypothetical protein